MTITPHFHTPPVPDTEEHRKHLVEQHLKQKGVALEEYNVTSKGNKEVNHIYITIDI